MSSFKCISLRNNFEKYQDVCELIRVMEEPNDNDIVSNSDKTILFLKETGLIDKRSYRVLLNENINMLSEIVSYYKRHKSFLQLNSCGGKTNRSLINLVKSNDQLSREEAENLLIKPVPVNFDKRPEIDFTISISSVGYYDTLEARSKGVLKDNNLNTIEDFLSYFNSKGNFLRLGKCGQKSNAELIAFANNLIKDCEGDGKIWCSNETIEVSESDRIISEFGKIFCIENEELSFLKNQIAECDIKIFNLLSFCAEKHLDSSTYYIFKTRYSYIGLPESSTNHRIGNDLNLSGEKVRLIIQHSIRKFLLQYKLFIQRIVSSTKTAKYLTLDGDFLHVDNDIVEKVNKNENTDFNVDIIALLLAPSFETHSLFTLKHLNRYHYCLIHKDLSDAFSFENYLSIVIKELNLCKKKKTNLNAYNFIRKRLTPKNANVSERILMVCRKIIDNALNLPVDENLQITLTSNKKKSIREEITDVLRKHPNVPLGIEKIFELVTDEKPDIFLDVQQLRAYLLKIENLKYIGRKSTYIYSETSSDDLRMLDGSLGDIAVNYLKKAVYPIHIYELIRFINKYLPITQKNLIANLKLTKRDEIVFYKHSFLGLKIYSMVFQAKTQPIPDKFYEKILPEIGLIRYNNLLPKQKRKYDGWLQKKKLFINDNGGISQNLLFKDFVSAIAKKYDITQMQVLSVLEPKINDGELCLDEEGRLNSTKCV